MLDSALGRKSSLALFVLGVFADDGNAATTANDLALDADFFNGCTNFHGSNLLI